MPPVSITLSAGWLRCATARRGGPPCGDEQCQCLTAGRLLGTADALFGELLRTVELSTRQRSAIVDWRRAYTQYDTEAEAAFGTAPAALRRGIQVVTEPGEGLPRGVDLDTVRRRFSEVPSKPVSAQTVAQVVGWVRQHLVALPPRRPKKPKPATKVRAGRARRKGAA